MDWTETAKFYSVENDDWKLIHSTAEEALIAWADELDVTAGLADALRANCPVTVIAFNPMVVDDAWLKAQAWRAAKGVAETWRDDFANPDSAMGSMKLSSRRRCWRRSQSLFVNCACGNAKVSG